MRFLLVATLVVASSVVNSGCASILKGVALIGDGINKSNAGSRDSLNSGQAPSDPMNEAVFTYDMEYVTTVTGRQGVRCRYENPIHGSVYKVFVGSKCPSKILLQ